MRHFWILLALAALYTGAAFSQDDPSKSFDVDNGVMISDDGIDKIWFGGGDNDPSVGPGIDAPIGSVYRKTDGSAFAKTGTGDTDWIVSGLGSGVSTQNADFGKSGNSSSGTFLLRAGAVPSNVSGITIILNSPSLRVVACSQEDIETYSVEVHEHSGNFTSSTLLYTLTVTAATSAVDFVNVAATTGKQLAVKVLNSVKNVGCTIGLKGLAE